MPKSNCQNEGLSLVLLLDNDALIAFLSGSCSCTGSGTGSGCDSISSASTKSSLLTLRVPEELMYVGSRSKSLFDDTFVSIL